MKPERLNWRHFYEDGSPSRLRASFRVARAFCEGVLDFVIAQPYILFVTAGYLR